MRVCVCGLVAKVIPFINLQYHPLPACALASRLLVEKGPQVFDLA